MRSRYVSIGLTIAVVVILLLHINYLRFVCDDAFISFRYAKNFVEGNGLVYNIGEKVEGYSNFLWTMLLSLFMKMGLDPVVMSQTLGILFSLGTVFLLLRLNRRFYPKENLFNYLAPLFLACCGAYAAWSTGGLETSFFTFLVLLGSFFFILGIDQPKHFAYSGMVFSLVCMTRLDGLVLAGVTFLFICHLTFVTRKMELRSLAAWTVAFSVPFLVYFTWRWSYYDKLLPNPFYVKIAGADLWRQGVAYFLDFLSRFWIWLIAIPLVFVRKARGLDAGFRHIPTYFVSLISAYSLYVILVGGDFMDMFRFFVPVLPFFLFLLQEGLRGVHHHFRSAGRDQAVPTLVSLEILLVALTVFLLAYPSRQGNEIWSKRGIDSVGLLRETAQLWSVAGQTLKKAGKPGESVATTAAGAIPYYSEMYAIDQLGLTLADLSHLRPRRSIRPGHHTEVTHDFLLSRRPTYIIGHPILVSKAQLAGGAILSESEKVYVENGYEVKFLKVEVSERESKYLYCLTWKGIESQTNAPRD